MFWFESQFSTIVKELKEIYQLITPRSSDQDKIIEINQGEANDISKTLNYLVDHFKEINLLLNTQKTSSFDITNNKNIINKLIDYDTKVKSTLERYFNITQSYSIILKKDIAEVDKLSLLGIIQHSNTNVNFKDKINKKIEENKLDESKLVNALRNNFTESDLDLVIADGFKNNINQVIFNNKKRDISNRIELNDIDKEIVLPKDDKEFIDSIEESVGKAKENEEDTLSVYNDKKKLIKSRVIEIRPKVNIPMYQGGKDIDYLDNRRNGNISDNGILSNSNQENNNKINQDDEEEFIQKSERKLASNKFNDKLLFEDSNKSSYSQLEQAIGSLDKELSDIKYNLLYQIN